MGIERFVWKLARLVWKSARCLWNSARFLQHLLWENSIRCGFGECAERGRRALERICGTIANFASTIILTREQQETRYLSPVLKPCFPEALRSVLIYDMGGDTFGASPF